jgi:Ni/Co efflux regulator RcnB
MRKILLTVLGVALIAASSAQVATASETHHARRALHARAATQAQMAPQFRNANDAVVWPSQSESSALSDYSEGHVISAPAGR